MATTLLQTTAGDGNLKITVDSYGAFGIAQTGGEGGVYDPIGAGTSASTVFESFLAVRVGSTGDRTILRQQQQSNIPFSQTTPTSAQSSGINIGELTVSLSQVVSDTFQGGNRTGSLLTQTYTATNPTTAAISIEIIRYFDGDLQFDGSIIDGGGRLATGINGRETLFETDRAGDDQIDSTFVGITAQGGNAVLNGRFEIDSYSGLLTRIQAGQALDDNITGDSTDPDQFVDNGYDVTLALLNKFDLAPGASITYTTLTQFGSGAPSSVIPALVSVIARDAVAAEPSNTGSFRFTREAQNISSPLLISFTIAGTATNGVDYTQIPLTTVIPAGQTFVDVTVNPIDDTVFEDDETVVLSLVDTNDYNLSTPTTATIQIADNDIPIDLVATKLDFNSDRKADILFRDKATGQNAIWLMDGLTPTVQSLIPSASTNFDIIDSGDFNGDRKADILFRDKATGQNAIWLMDGLTPTVQSLIPSAGTNFDIIDSGDFNGDRKADILFRDKATGQNAIWLMDGLTPTVQSLIPPASINFDIIGAADYNANGKADILFRDKATGQNAIWLMDGLTPTVQSFIPSASTNFQIFGF